MIKKIIFAITSLVILHSIGNASDKTFYQERYKNIQNDRERASTHHRYDRERANKTHRNGEERAYRTHRNNFTTLVRNLTNITDDQKAKLTQLREDYREKALATRKLRTSFIGFTSSIFDEEVFTSTYINDAKEHLKFRAQRIKDVLVLLTNTQKKELFNKIQEEKIKNKD